MYNFVAANAQLAMVVVYKVLRSVKILIDILTAPDIEL